MSADGSTPNAQQIEGWRVCAVDLNTIGWRVAEALGVANPDANQQIHRNVVADVVTLLGIVEAAKDVVRSKDLAMTVEGSRVLYDRANPLHPMVALNALEAAVRPLLTVES